LGDQLEITLESRLIVAQTENQRCSELIICNLELIQVLFTIHHNQLISEL